MCYLNVSCHGVDLQVIQSKIYEIRGQRVMLDFDLADLYGTETKYLKRSVRSNLIASRLILCLN